MYLYVPVTHLQPSPSTNQHINTSTHQNINTINTPSHHPLTVEIPHLPTFGQILLPLRASRDKHSQQWRLVWISVAIEIGLPASSHDSMLYFTLRGSECPFSKPRV
ncbi:hypothetical protein ACN38_g6916 [Penicillium nordicum]|uniref:Uncharacterized protein n=1 Tax=Penicillium nordicum TaxID=229535 RepID=A0A0M9WET3_9EURO|nr:hypothetical protein ACN38_g6916 [Penicillium nordicum]